MRRSIHRRSPFASVVVVAGLVPLRSCGDGVGPAPVIEFETIDDRHPVTLLPAG